VAQLGESKPVRVHASFRVDPYIWGLFKERCWNLGLSTCFTLEGLIRAWLTGEQVQVPQPRPLTVNMTVNYEVARPRRAKEVPDIRSKRCPYPGIQEWCCCEICVWADRLPRLRGVDLSQYRIAVNKNGREGDPFGPP